MSSNSGQLSIYARLTQRQVRAYETFYLRPLRQSFSFVAAIFLCLVVVSLRAWIFVNLEEKVPASLAFPMVISGLLTPLLLVRAVKDHRKMAELVNQRGAGKEVLAEAASSGLFILHLAYAISAVDLFTCIKVSRLFH